MRCFSVYFAVDCGDERVYGSADNIVVNACAPSYVAVGQRYADITDSLRGRTFGKSVLAVCEVGILNSETLFDSVGYSVKTSVSVCADLFCFAVVLDVKIGSHALLRTYKAVIHKLKRRRDVYELLVEYSKYLFRGQLLVLHVRNVLYRISDSLSHLGREVETVVVFE